MRLIITRDNQAGVYIAHSPDLDGLVVEATTLRDLFAEALAAAAALLQLRGTSGALRPPGALSAGQPWPTLPSPHAIAATAPMNTPPLTQATLKALLQDQSLSLQRTEQALKQYADQLDYHLALHDVIAAVERLQKLTPSATAAPSPQDAATANATAPSEYDQLMHVVEEKLLSCLLQGCGRAASPAACAPRSTP